MRTQLKVRHYSFVQLNDQISTNKNNIFRNTNLNLKKISNEFQVAAEK